jgi:hypothetical protein
LAGASDEQYESILNDEIALLARKFHALHKFHKERGDHLGVALSAETPPTSSSTALRGKCLTPPTSTTTPTEMTTGTKATTRRRTSLETRRRSSRRSYPERVLP